jgi:hypothetical protein
MEINGLTRREISAIEFTKSIETTESNSEAKISEVTTTDPLIAELQGAKAEPNARKPILQKFAGSSAIEQSPPDVVHYLGGMLPAKDALSVATASKTMRHLLMDHVEHYTAEKRSKHVDNLEEFKAVLSIDTIGSPLLRCRGDLSPIRGEVLATLGHRITALPDHDQEEARGAFIEVAEKFDGKRPPQLDHVLAVAKEGLPALSLLPNARTAIERGENVKSLCERLNITDRRQIVELQSLAVNCRPIRDALGHQSISTIAETYGIDDPALLANLGILESFYNGHTF